MSESDDRQAADQRGQPAPEGQSDPATRNGRTSSAQDGGAAEREAGWREGHGASSPDANPRDTASGAERDIEAGESPT